MTRSFSPACVVSRFPYCPASPTVTLSYLQFLDTNTSKGSTFKRIDPIFSRFCLSQSNKQASNYTRPLLASASFFASHSRRSRSDSPALLSHNPYSNVVRKGADVSYTAKTYIRPLRAPASALLLPEPPASHLPRMVSRHYAR
jgi:hypothetical protein